MSTPLKALIQERLRAKIVRDDDDVASFHASDAAYGSALLSNTTPLIDPAEYLVPPPLPRRDAAKPQRPHAFAESRNGGGAETMSFDDDIKHYNADFHYGADAYYTANREDAYDDYDRYETRRSRASETKRRALSPAKTFADNKRQRRDARHGRVSSEPSSHFYSEQTAIEMDERSGREIDPYADFAAPVRKNYDLSSAYQRYREVSGRRGVARTGGVSEPRRGDLSDENPRSDPWSRTSSRNRNRDAKTLSPSFEYDEYRQLDRTPSAERDHDFGGRWPLSRRSPEKNERHSDRSGHDDDRRRPTSSTFQSYRRREVYPVSHVTPAFEAAVLSPGAASASARHRVTSPPRRQSFFGHSRFFESRAVSESSEKLVFPTVASRVVSALRSPASRHFLRHADSTAAVGSAADRRGCHRDDEDILSPGSHQAAKDFVEKRQKRGSQGTPRTMATHRWLQSMVDARKDHKGAAPPLTMAPLMSLFGDGRDEAYAPPSRSPPLDEWNGDAPTEGDDANASEQQSGPATAVADAHEDSHSIGDTTTSSASVPTAYAPRRYTATCTI